MIKIIISVLIFSIAGPNAFAHEDANGIVKERMDAMSSISDNAKDISSMLKGKSDYDSERILNASRKISIHTEAFLKMFPEGSTDHPSEASPKIWEKSEDFSKKAQDLVSFANNLAQLAEAESSSAIIGEAFNKVKSTCKSCHAAFRIKK